jgi:hypothetical protein
VDPVPVPLLLGISGSAGNRTQKSGSIARNSIRPQKRIPYTIPYFMAYRKYILLTIFTIQYVDVGTSNKRYIIIRSCNNDRGRIISICKQHRINVKVKDA